MNRRERRAAAQQSRTGAKPSAGAAPDALYAQGLDHLRSRRLVDAQLSCQNALAIDPRHADSFFLMALLALEAGNADHALDWFGRAIAQNPKVDYLVALGTTLQQLKRFEEAVNAFEKVVQLKPDHPQAWKSLANALAAAGRADETLRAWDHVLALNPGDRDAAYQCAERLGNALLGERRFEEALASHQQAHAIDPVSANACNNVGAALQAMHRHEEALSWFDRAVGLRPAFIVALRNKALSLVQLGRLGEATAILEAARAIDPGNADVEWNLSLLQLMDGDFESGWAGREARWRGRMRSASYPYFSQAMWLGDVDIAGKTVLVQEDEGLGDTIQFARYIPMLAARGARVVLVVRDVLYPLLSGLPGVSQCIPTSAAGALPEFDLHCPICSLPLAFKTRLDSIPSDVPYLPVPSEQLVAAWRSRLAQREDGSGTLRVGLVWSGNPQHDNDHNRSIPLQKLLRITDADARFISLQKGLRPGDETLLAKGGIIDPTSHLTDFAETAALVSCLDLVISVDTSVAHLAGSLGRPTWLLLPLVPDYRWLREREDSPWYPSARLFRQSARRDWDEVLTRVRNELAALTRRGRRK